MAATQFTLSNKHPRVIIHPTTAPTADNIAELGTVWFNLTGPHIYVASATIVGPPQQTTWSVIL